MIPIWYSSPPPKEGNYLVTIKGNLLDGGRVEPYVSRRTYTLDHPELWWDVATWAYLPKPALEPNADKREASRIKARVNVVLKHLDTINEMREKGLPVKTIASAIGFNARYLQLCIAEARKVGVKLSPKGYRDGT